MIPALEKPAKAAPLRACISSDSRSKFKPVQANSPRKNSLPWSDERRLQRWVRKLKHQAIWLGFQAFPQLSRAALAMESSRFSPADATEFFSQDLHEVPPALNEDLLDLYGRSEQVVANLFAFHNISEALEGDFNWEMHQSAAWRRELHSFDYALALGMTVPELLARVTSSE